MRDDIPREADIVLSHGAFRCLSYVPFGSIWQGQCADGNLVADVIRRAGMSESNETLSGAKPAATVAEHRCTVGGAFWQFSRDSNIRLIALRNTSSARTAPRHARDWHAAPQLAHAIP